MERYPDAKNRQDEGRDGLKVIEPEIELSDMQGESNGMPVRGFPNVGALLKGEDPKSAGLRCTRSLVGCDKFLTAAHCVHKDPIAKRYFVFFQELGVFEVADIKWEPEKFERGLRPVDVGDAVPPPRLPHAIRPASARSGAAQTFVISLKGDLTWTSNIIK